MKNPSKENAFTLAIIGGGLTGTSMLCQFVGRMQALLAQGNAAPAPIDMHVIEKQDFFGPGFPHSDQNSMPFHLINMCARDMSILSAEPDDFQDWVNHHIHEMEEQFPGVAGNEGSPDPKCHHFPRPVMGEYLKARFHGAVLEAKRIGIRVHLHPGCEAIDMSEGEDDQVRVSIMDRQSRTEVVLHADRVLLATGHWFGEERRDGYFPSPWPPRSLQENIPEGVEVGIIGTSLSAVDAVLTLTANGCFLRSPSGELLYEPPSKPRRLALYSRRALLPTVRGRIGPYKNQFTFPGKIQALVDEKGHLSLEDLFDLLDRDLKKAYGHPFPWKEVTSPEGTAKSLLEKHISYARYGDGPHGEIVWQTVLQQIFPMARNMYLSLSPDERIRLDKDFNTLFFIYAAPMPMINAEKLLALMNAGMVVVRKLTGESAFRATEAPFTFTFQGPGGKEMEATHPYVVDARGQSPFYNKNKHMLAVNLLRSGTVEVEPLPMKSSMVGERMGGLWIEPHTHRIRRTRSDGNVAVSERITAVGAMTRGQIIDASMAHGSAVSTETIARDWADYVFS